MSTPQFSEEGILWREWNDETLRIIDDNKSPVLLFVADPDPMVWPFLRETFKELSANPKLRDILHQFFVALFIKVDDLPNLITELGAGSRYHVAVLSPYALTPMVTFTPANGTPADVVTDIVAFLESLRDFWGS